jgi:hypothetical protein
MKVFQEVFQIVRPSRIGGRFSWRRSRIAAELPLRALDFFMRYKWQSNLTRRFSAEVCLSICASSPIIVVASLHILALWCNG